MAIGYRRVSRKSPCRICGKPDWCSTTIDHSVSFCARSWINADRHSHNGWGVYYHNTEKRLYTNYPISAKLPFRAEQVPVAPVDVRNKIYQELIQLSPLSEFNESGVGDDCTGLRIRDLSRYGLFPKATLDRHLIVRSLIESFVKDDALDTAFKGVPGFWRGSNGGPRLGGDFDFVEDLILIPFIDPKGLIQACQIRCVKDASAWSGRYLWLSSIRQRDGCSPGTPLHHEGALGFKGNSIETVLVTEGALKAATVQAFLPDRYVVGNSGVATSHREIVKTARKKNLEIAFDADCFTNPHVARSLASLISLRTREQKFLSYDHPVRIITWDKRFKGIDDALIAGATLKYLDVSEWLASLTPDCFEAARHPLVGIYH